LLWLSLSVAAELAFVSEMKDQHWQPGRVEPRSSPTWHLVAEQSAARQPGGLARYPLFKAPIYGSLIINTQDLIEMITR